MVNDKMVNIMKNVYISPSTTIVAICSALICQVASVKGNGPGFGGEDNNIIPG